MQEFTEDEINTLSKGPEQFSQFNTMGDPALSQLRDQIKNAMIPLLIKVFQARLDLSQAVAPPSRLTSTRDKLSAEEITAQLKAIDKDLHVLMLWCQSCRKQIDKALAIPEESAIRPTAPSPANPAVSKSFSDAVSAQKALYEEELSATAPKKRWWNKIIK